MSQKSDAGGNLLILSIRLKSNDRRLVLAATYGPNEVNIGFYDELSRQLATYDDTGSSLILGGDWNVPQDYVVDTKNYLGRNNEQNHQCIKNIMGTFDLTDIWRDQHQNSSQFTWHGPNKKQARLDYFLISSDLSPLIKSSDIGIAHRSDHSPISLNLKLVEQPRGRGTWKFNNSLLSDTQYVEIIKQCIKETIELYAYNPDEPNKDLIRFAINDSLLWETVKLMIRGKTISFASAKKRERSNRENVLEEQLFHLQNSADRPEALISEVENELKSIRDIKMKGIILRAKTKWKVEGDKGTKYFCNLEKRHYNEKLISKLIDHIGMERTDIFEILEEQKNFYESLYSSRQTDI